jgi:hypothetical protein
MNKHRSKGLRLVASPLFGVTIAVALLWAGAVHGQDPRVSQPFTPPPRFAVPEDPPASSYWFNESTEVWAIVAVIAGAITLASAVGTFWVRWSATTDPAELAKVDPWLRANLEKYQAEQRSTPPARLGEPGAPPHT